MQLRVWDRRQGPPSTCVTMEPRILVAKSPASAFTLIELLVVVAVLAILAALVTSAASGAMRKARQTRCVNSIRQLSVAMGSFIGSHGAYPGIRNPEVVGTTTNAWIWCHALEREMTSSDEFIPPRFKGHLENTVWDCPAQPPSQGQGGSDVDYGYNDRGLVSAVGQSSLGLGGKSGSLWPDNHVDDPWIPVKESDVLHPSRMIALGDGITGWNDSLVVSVHFSRWKPIGANPGAIAVTRRHQRRANVAFADGHVEALSFFTLFEDTNDEALRLWNRDHLPHRERLTQ